MLGRSLVAEGNAESPGFFQPGSIYTFQYGYRDNHPTQPQSPCASDANLTNAGEVTLAP